ncbi:transcriptional regulator, AlpA family [Nitrosomonas eutropha]|uniref:Transcriptional regulator, AlpA family n=1 Tax=Nitrosomonas eutropha TaxID=916 RepID=A0A1I7GLR9_9PROT|nr:hypothetical protein [Nitrosomonas eutropha]SFU49442.1 transcriptional regulator, AlpA family [Nitrosomonas eutropha]
MTDQKPYVVPETGWCRWNQIKSLVPVSKETWRQMGLNGTGPTPIRLGERTTLYRCEDVRRWLADPLFFKQGG